MIHCVNCQTTYKKINSGVNCITMFDNPPRPYQLFRADLFECPGCKNRVVSDFGTHAIAEHFMPDFQEKVQQDPNAYLSYEKPKSGEAA